MINLESVKKYCRNYQDIENYDKAIADNSQTWDCHHRKQEMGFSKSELKSMNEYYDVPAYDLIFITHSVHMSIHKKGQQTMKGKHHSDETKKKMSEKNKGKTLPEEQKTKISESLKGNTNAKGNQNWKGKHHSAETRAKMSEKSKGNQYAKGYHHTDEAKKKMSESHKGKPKKKFKWLTPSGEIVEMNKSNAKQYHKDWILIE